MYGLVAKNLLNNRFPLRILDLILIGKFMQYSYSFSTCTSIDLDDVGTHLLYSAAASEKIQHMLLCLITRLSVIYNIHIYYAVLWFYACFFISLKSHLHSILQ